MVCGEKREAVCTICNYNWGASQGVGQEQGKCGHNLDLHTVNPYKCYTYFSGNGAAKHGGNTACAVLNGTALNNVPQTQPIVRGECY